MLVLTRDSILQQQNIWYGNIKHEKVGWACDPNDSLPMKPDFPQCFSQFSLLFQGLSAFGKLISQILRSRHSNSLYTRGRIERSLRIIDMFSNVLLKKTCFYSIYFWWKQWFIASIVTRVSEVKTLIKWEAQTVARDMWVIVGTENKLISHFKGFGIVCYLQLRAKILFY